MANGTSSSPVAIITGAGSGIGAAIAEVLSIHGWRLALAGRDETKLRNVALSLRRAPGELRVIPTDVSDEAGVTRLIHEAHESLGRIDALINNAGDAPYLPIEQTDPETIRRVFAVNALGPAYAIREAWPIFTKQKSGRIINVTTIGTVDPFPGFFAYASAKAAADSMTKVASKEGAAIGVRAFAVAPGAVETAMLRAIFDNQKVPPADCLTPRDVADLICDCAEGRRDGDSGRTLTIRRDQGRPRVDVC